MFGKGNAAVQKKLRLFSSICAFLFFALALILPSGYSYGAGLALLVALPFMFSKENYKNLDSSTLLLIAAFLIFSGSWIVEVYFFQLGSREYDKPSRLVLAVIALLFLYRFPPKQSFLFAGIATGACATGIFAIFIKLTQRVERVDGFTNAIQYGNLSVLLGLMCLAGLYWAWQRTRFKKTWIVILTLGFILGVSASILSGSRGGWIGMPLVLLYIAVQYRKVIPLKYIGMLVMMFVGVVSLAYFTPATGIEKRVGQVFSDLSLYQQGKTFTSIGTRLELWKGATILVSEKPWFGWGEKNYHMRLQELQQTGIIKPYLLSHPHNDFLNAAARRGLIGAVCLLLLYLVPFLIFKKLHRTNDIENTSLSIAGLILVFCYLDFGLSQAFFEHNSGVMFYAFAVIFIYTAMFKIHTSKRVASIQ